jgi:hypothetical protein
VLSARAGVQPYLLGELHGCSDVASAQSTGASAKTQEFHALTADLAWGLDMRAEALGVGQIIGKPLIATLLKPQFLWFKDLVPGGSNGIGAAVEGLPQIAVGKPALYKVRSHPCYPYTEDVEYHVVWSGQAIPAARPGCTWEAGQGSCWINPRNGVDINMVWKASGANTLTVTSVRDKYGRQFKGQSTVLKVVSQ